jgi:hypothetical protein
MACLGLVLSILGLCRLRSEARGREGHGPKSKSGSLGVALRFLVCVWNALCSFGREEQLWFALVARARKALRLGELAPQSSVPLVR